MANELDYFIEESEFKLQSCNYIHFRIITLGKGMNPLSPPVMCWIVLLLFVYKDGFGIK